jgi:hypothetical protein
VESGSDNCLLDFAMRYHAKEILIPASGYAGRTASPAPAVPATMASAHAPMASAHGIDLAAGLPGGICSVDAGARARVSHTKTAAGCSCAHVGGPSADNALCAAYHSSASRVLGPSIVVCYNCLHGVQCQESSTSTAEWARASQEDQTR